MGNIKKDFVWNALYTGIMGTFNAIMLIVCIRINGLVVSGRFAITLTCITILSMIGDYGLRTYQVTDVKRERTFNEYIITKLIVLAIMNGVALIYILTKKYILEDSLIFVYLLIIKIVDNLSDIFQGELQLQKKLYLASKYAFTRVTIYLLVFIVCDIVTQNILLSLFFMVITNIILFIYFDLIRLKACNQSRKKIDKKQVKLIINQCFPIFLVSLLNLYIINVVKFIIDKNGLYEMQTYYNIIYITMFILSLLVIFIIKPLLEPMSVLYQNNEKRKFINNVIKMIIVIIIATVLLEIMLFTFGTRILSIIYNVDISIYKTELCIMGISAGMYAISSLLFNILIILRKQKGIMTGYTIVTVICTLINYVVVIDNIDDAVKTNLLVMILLLVCSVIIFCKEVYEIKKANNSIN